MAHLVGDKHPLIVACKAGNSDEIKRLVLQQGKDVAARLEYVNSYDRNGSTPIVHTVWDGHTAAAEMLLDLGADPNAANVRKNTALHLACQQGHMDVVRCLVRHGANMHTKNWQGLAPHEMCGTDEACAEMERLLAKETAEYEAAQVARYERMMTATERAYYRAVFETIDTDASGDLSYNELYSLLETMLGGGGGKKGKADEEAVREFFRFFDTDHSETISLSEFLRGCAKYVGDSKDAASKANRHTARGRVAAQQRKIAADIKTKRKRQIAGGAAAAPASAAPAAKPGIHIR